MFPNTTECSSRLSVVHRGVLRLLFGLMLLAINSASSNAASPVSFEFTLKSKQRTSAGVFQNDGTLVRTIWSGVTYPAGENTGTWDGLDDWGNLVSNGKYQIRILTNACTYTWEGVVGNTSSSWTGSTVWNGYNNIAGLAIAGNKAYYANGYPEGASTSGTFSTTDPQGSRVRLLYKGGANTRLVATDGNYAYWAGRDRGKFSVNRFVFAVRVSDDEEVDFPNGVSYRIGGDNPTYQSVIALRTDGTDGRGTSGLAGQRKGSLLFVSDEDKNEITVVNKTTGELARKVKEITAPGALAVDGADDLWVVRKKGAVSEVAQYAVATDGALRPLQVIDAKFEKPMALGVSPDNATLVVVDGGGSQQLKAFSTKTGSPIWTLGQAGGYTTNTAVTNDRFMFDEIGFNAFVTFQPDGSFWVGDYGNGRVQHYSATREFIDRVQYRPSSYFCSIDANNPQRLFSDYLEYEVDYSLPLGPTNGSWKLVRNWEKAVRNLEQGGTATYGRFFPNTFSNGRTYALIPKSETGQKAGSLEMFELAADGKLRKTGIVVPTAYASLQPDGSIRTVTQASASSKTGPMAGTITWTSAVLTGFDTNANPTYALPKTLASTPYIGTDPVWWNGAAHLRAGVQTTSDVVVSFDAGLPGDDGRQSTGYHLGGVRVGGTGWLWRTSLSTHRNYSGDWPEDGAFDVGNRVQYAGSVPMTVERHVFYGYNGEFYKNSQANKFRHYFDNGLYVGEFGELGANVGFTSGVLFSPAKMAGNVHNPWIVKLTDGRVYLYHNDEGWHGGVHRWRIDGLDTITELTVNVDWKAPTVPGLRAEYFDSADLNNAYLKTVRTDNTVNVNWNNKVPADTALTAADTYSARWSGFVTPRHSETYTFHTLADDGVRLWVNDQIVIDQWTKSDREQSGIIALAAGQRYALKLEYFQNTAIGRAHLSWSSSRQTKQIIPQNALCWAPWLYPVLTEGKFDLFDGQPIDGSVRNGLYGVTRDSATDTPGDDSSNRWIVRTSRFTYRSALNRKNDLSFLFQNDKNAIRTLTRDLGSTSDDTTEWSLSGEINHSDGRFNDGDNGGHFLEILDDSGRIIARLTPLRAVPPQTDQRIVGNTADLWHVDAVAVKSGEVKLGWEPLTISAKDGQITFVYGKNPPALTNVFDPAANWRRAKTLRFYFWHTEKASSGRHLSVRDFQFAQSPAPHVPVIKIEASPTEPIRLTMTTSTDEPTDSTIKPSTLSTAKLPTELTAIIEQFLKQQAERVTAPFEAEVERLNAGYVSEIDRLLALGKSFGKGANIKEDLDALSAERKSIRDKNSVSVPETDDEKTPAALKTVRGTYRASLAKLSATRDANLKKLTVPLDKRLGKLEADFTKADRPSDAKAVRAYRDSLTKSSPGR